MVGWLEFHSTLHETLEYVRQFDTVLLSKTQTAADAMEQIQSIALCECWNGIDGKHGEGLLLAARLLLPFNITHSSTYYVS